MFFDFFGYQLAFQFRKLKDDEQTNGQLPGGNAMRKERQPFGIYLRSEVCGAKIYYYWVYDTQGKRRQFSTGCTDQKKALKEVMRRFKEGMLIPNDRLILKKWTQVWFEYDLCPYIQGHLIRGFSYSRTHAANQRSYLERFIWPTFGNRGMDTIKADDIEKWIFDLLNDGTSRDTVNRCLATIRLIFNEAVRLGLVEFNPAKLIRKLKHSPKEKGILTEDEEQKLFDPQTRFVIWGRRQIAFWAFLVSYFGGLRQEELISLQVEDIKDDGIVVCHGWDRKTGIKGTKNEQSRIVPIPGWLIDQIKTLSTEGFVFSLTGGKSPVSPTYLYEAWYLALGNIGIDRKSQKERVLGTHSLRHGLVSKLLGDGVPAAVVAKVVGHQSIGLTTNTYHHSKPIHLELVAKAQQSFKKSQLLEVAKA